MASHLNIALKTAIIQSRKKQKRIARLARIDEVQLSRIVHGHAEPTPKERERLAAILGKPERDLFPVELAS